MIHNIKIQPGNLYWVYTVNGPKMVLLLKLHGESPVNGFHGKKAEVLVGDYTTFTYPSELFEVTEENKQTGFPVVRLYNETNTSSSSE